MKRRISILLSLILLISSSGFTLNKHYCNGELANIFLLPHFGDCCDSSMAMEDDSCNDEFFSLLLDSTLGLISSKNAFVCSAQWIQVAETLLIDTNGVISKPLEIVLSSPPLSNIKIYLRVESFLN